ncbi:Hypothetical predicted protein, partial [Olea europaea subsp. europaea]
MYKARLSNFKRLTLPKPNPGPNYAILMEEYSGILVGIETVMETGRGSCNSDLPIEDFGLPPKEEDLGDIDHNESQKSLFKWKAIDAFKVMEVGLNFMYDALYTKM